MPELSGVLVMNAVAKLISVGVAAWKANAEEGWGTEELEALKEALESLSELGQILGKDEHEQSLVQQHCALVTVAFGEAWRRHWHCDGNLAPRRMRSSRMDFLRPKPLRERIRQVEEALANARLERSLVDTSLRGELESMDRITDNPLLSPWYQALWKEFEDPSHPASPSPLLLLEHGGDDKRRFERLALVAFREGLVSDRCRALREWLLTNKRTDRDRTVRELLAARVSDLAGVARTRLHSYNGAIRAG